MQKESTLLWEDCLAVIKDIVSEAAFNAWFKPIIPLSYEDRKFTIQVPSQFFYEYLEEKYVNVLKMTLNRFFGEGTTLKYRVEFGGLTKKLNGQSVTYPGEEPKTTHLHPQNKMDVTKAPPPFKVA